MRRTLIYLAVLAVIRESHERQRIWRLGRTSRATYVFGTEPDDSATVISYRCWMDA